MTTDTLTLRMQHLEQLCGKLQKEKSETQEDFGKQRKKFMEKLVEVESERTLLANTIERYNTEIREISTQLMAKDEEVNNVRVVAKMSTKQVREDFDVDRVKYEEEIASLRQIMTGERACFGGALFKCLCVQLNWYCVFIRLQSYCTYMHVHVCKESVNFRMYGHIIA